MSQDPHSRLQGISAFVHAVDAGSFTAAAARMGLSKSAVGKSVGRLEESLGTRLLARTTRSLNLTAEGQTYYRSCLRVLDELGSVEALLASHRQEAAGLLRVSLPVSFGQRWVMPVLHEIAQRHPKVSLEASFADRRVDLIEEGVDLVVRLGDPGDQANLVGRRIGVNRSVLCASPAYLAAKGRPQSLDELESHDCIAFARDGRPLPWLLANAKGHRINVNIKPRHTISHADALRDAALAGLGLAYLSTWLAADGLRTGRLECVLTPESIDDMPIYVLWPRSRDLAPKVRVAVDALVKAFLPIPPWERA
jgi:DNA-binding transcriptional LysR family regulator